MGSGTCRNGSLSERVLGADNHRSVVVRVWTTWMGARDGGHPRVWENVVGASKDTCPRQKFRNNSEVISP